MKTTMRVIIFSFLMLGLVSGQDLTHLSPEKIFPVRESATGINSIGSNRQG